MLKQELVLLTSLGNFENIQIIHIMYLNIHVFLHFCMIQDKDYTRISIASLNELAEVQSKSQDMI